MPSSETVRVRALIGHWEGQEAMFLGGVNHDQYEAILDQDSHDGTDRWGVTVQAWIDSGPGGITETREVDLTLSVPTDLFRTPQLDGAVDQTEESE